MGDAVSGGPVVILAGGTGGAKLARGMLDVVGGDELVVIANTGDDIEIYGSYVSPDPDLVTFWLADRIDERGWGLNGDTFQVMDGLRELGLDVWFNLGDRDLAICLERARRLQRGERPTEAQQAVTAALGVTARVLPMADQPVRTRVLADGTWASLQEFLIRRRGQGDVQDVDFRGRGDARPSPEVLEAIATARAIVIGPSNPVISIGPILSVPGLRDAITASRARTVAVSPIVRGAVVKGPTEAFMRWQGQSLDAAGIAAVYAPLLDGMVADESSSSLPSLEIDTLMDSADSRRQLAENTLSFALGLS
ncbi:MAG: 2-phospho-L-lactate transferase [Solirubrobacteraceae bacterium]|jgi:LPPG:FO 2-phospho-L-lactate transferase|nr:2-phospho-L-lactate transferase [Solirubrobacteraceae bacterium]